MSAQYAVALEEHLALLRRLEGSPDLIECRCLNLLERADTFYVDPQIALAIATAAQDMPDWTLLPELLPAPFGFAWLAGQFFGVVFQQPAGSGQPDIDVPMTMLSWGIGKIFAADSGALHDGLVVHVGGPMPGESTRPWLEGSWRFGDSWRIAVARNAQATIEGYRRGDNPGVESPLYLAMRFFAAFCVFVQQRILSTNSHVVDRHARKRAVRAGLVGDPVVRVIELRRHASAASSVDEATAREWSCQWLVRGHWRQQFYPSLHLNQAIWVAPYVKGPIDKPLKPSRATVYAVVR